MQAFKMKNHIKELKKELEKHVDKKYKDGAIRFFKEDVNPIGVRTGIVRKIASKFYSEHKKKFSKKDWINLCEALWEKKINNSNVPCFEYGIIINSILRKQVKDLDKKDSYIFEKWVDMYITNWAHCDILCTGVIGEVVRKNPELSDETLKWAKSKNRWKKRASAVCYIKLSREKRF
jgi:3-methyladenine DNA glycosylase AlkD